LTPATVAGWPEAAADAGGCGEADAAGLAPAETAALADGALLTLGLDDAAVDPGVLGAVDAGEAEVLTLAPPPHAASSTPNAASPAPRRRNARRLTTGS